MISYLVILLLALSLYLLLCAEDEESALLYLKLSANSIVCLIFYYLSPEGGDYKYSLATTFLLTMHLVFCLLLIDYDKRIEEKNKQ